MSKKTPLPLLIKVLQRAVQFSTAQGTWYATERTIVEGLPGDGGEIVGSLTHVEDVRLVLALQQTVDDNLFYLNQHRVFILQTARANLHNAVFDILLQHEDCDDLTPSQNAMDWYRLAFSQLHNIGYSLFAITGELQTVIASYVESAYDHLGIVEIETLQRGFVVATAVYRADLARCQPLVQGDNNV